MFHVFTFSESNMQGNREFQGGMEINERRLVREHVRLQLRKKERQQRKINKRRAFTDFITNNDNNKDNNQLNNNNQDKVNEFEMVLELDENAQKCTENDNESIHLECCDNICKLINISKCPPIDEIIKSGIVPRLIEFLINDNNPKLQFKSAYILTTISSGISDHTSFLIEKHDGLIKHFINLLLSKNKNICSQAVLALGNIVSDSTKYRDFVLLNDGLKNLKILQHKCIKSSNASINDLEILRNVSWTMSNFCRVKPQTDIKYIKEMIECLTKMLLTSPSCDDDEILLNTVWGFSYLVDCDRDCDVTIVTIGNNIKLMKQYGAFKPLIDCLEHRKYGVAHGALRTLGHIVSVHVSNEETQDIINMGVCDKLLYILSLHNDNHKNISLLKEACWMISNIASGTQSQIEKVILSNIFPKLINILNNSSFSIEIRQEAAWGICNAISVGNRIQIEYLVHRGVITSLVSLLELNDSKLSLIVMEGLSNILKCGENIKIETGNDENEFKNAIETAHCLDKV